MKHILLALSLFFFVSVSAQDEMQNDVPFGPLTPEIRMQVDLYAGVLYALNLVDSLTSHGRYLQALEVLDSLDVNWKEATDMNPTPMMYLKRTLIYTRMEEWHKVVLTTTECIDNYKETMPDDIASVTYEMQGLAYRTLGFYQMAIRSYENANSIYSKLDNVSLSGQGGTLCNIADCYIHLKKYVTASSFYKRGLSLYLTYFNVSKEWLLKNNLIVTDSYKNTVLGVFGAHLYKMYLYELECGDTFTSKEYLRMSAHCGYRLALSEYESMNVHR